MNSTGKTNAARLQLLRGDLLLPCPRPIWAAPAATPDRDD